MNEPLDELYFKWLYRHVASDRLKNPKRTYWRLLRMFYTKEFIWLISNDDNRVEDGRDLRCEFINEVGIDDPDKNWMSMECSFLEMLIGLAKRCAFETDGGSAAWFWHLVDNLNLGGFNDEYFQTRRQEQYVEETIDAVIWRLYDHDGRGGLFPLNHPQHDQREIELWYQLSCYLLEGHGV